jgi:hypothetical protein
LELAEDVSRRIDVALLLLDVGEYPCDAGALDFDENLYSVSNDLWTSFRAPCLALGDCP